MVKTIFLHIGFDKTGSTSIQFTAHNNRALLNRMGVLYPSGTWHPMLGSCFVTEPESYYFNLAEGRTLRSIEHIREEDAKYLAALEDEFAAFTGQTAVLSYEGFCGLPQDALNGMKSFLYRLATTVKVVVYCRHPVDYALAAMSQCAMSAVPLWESVPFQDFLGSLSSFSRVFGKENVMVREFNRPAFLRGDIRFDFFSLVGLSESDIEPLCKDQDVRNSSLSQEAVLIARELATYDDYMTSTDFGLRYGHHLQKIEGSSLRLTEQQLSDVEEKTAPHLRYLADNFGIRFLVERNASSAIETSSLPVSTIKSLAALIHETTKDPSNTHFSIEESKDAYCFRSVPYLQVKMAVPKPSIVTSLGGLLQFDCHFFLRIGVKKIEVRLYIFDSRRRLAFQTDSTLLGQHFSTPEAGSYCATFSVFCDLPDGRYSLGFALHDISSDTNVIELANYGRYCEFSIEANRVRTSKGYAPLLAIASLSRLEENQRANVIADGSGKLDILLAPTSMNVNEVHQVQVKIHNLSSMPWTTSDDYPINISYHWYDLQHNGIVYDGKRTPLAATAIEPGGSTIQLVNVLAPENPGERLLVLTVVQEFVGWLEEFGFEVGTQRVFVGATGVLPAAPKQLTGFVARSELM
jgi:hypothetical protein